VVAYTIVDISVGYYWRGTSSKLIIHESYDPLQLFNDIALVKLSAAATLSGE
jgi:secreted trypsin-like serine protease